MKTIYISLPMTGHEDTLEQRLKEAVTWCKEKFPDSRVITPRMIQVAVEGALRKPKYSDYLCADLQFIMEDADIVVFCEGWQNSRGCRLEHAVAQEFGKKIIYKE
ncbi:MAG: DUF4406 domain-containing protein [Paludibacteraceae bacterium]